MIRLSIVIIILITYCLPSFSQESEKTVVDYRADLSLIKEQGEYIELIGNVVFYHNGVFITCDTAYRYSEQRMEGVGRVIINSDSTYIYGDKFVYNGESNIANIYAPLIKTIDGDAVMYTRNMTFNTLENSGTYYGGGTSNQGTSVMESEKGVYFSENRSIILTGNVNMRNENYEIKSDSIAYNFDTEVVDFLSRANIWNHKGEFLVANNGNYNTRTEVYDFYEDAYILTDERELWADSILYQGLLQNARLNMNVQVLDTIQKVITLGDLGSYWGVTGKVLLTVDPAAITYGETEADSIFLRAEKMVVVPMLERGVVPVVLADTLDMALVDSLGLMYGDSLYTGDYSLDSMMMLRRELVDSLALDSSFAPGFLAHPTLFDHIPDSLLVGIPDSLLLDMPDSLRLIMLDSLGGVDTLSYLAPDSLALDTMSRDANDTLVLGDRVLSKKELRQAAKAAKKLETEKKREAKRLEKLNRLIAKEKEREERELGHLRDSLVDSLLLDSMLIDTTTIARYVKREPDSSDYYMYCIDSVVTFKEDMQMICDSMAINSHDSVTYLEGNPIVWSQGNQITATSMSVFSLDGQPHRAELYDFPIIAQSVGRNGEYNQIKGKFMEAFFKEQSLDVLYVDGNSECVYYKTEEYTGEIDAVVNVNSADMEIYFEDSEMSDLKWFQGIEFDVFPVFKKTEETKEILEGFVWQGERRPKSRYDITTRSVRDSQRAQYEGLEKPVFMITSEIEDEKIELTEKGLWRDRFELLPIDKQNFFETQPK